MSDVNVTVHTPNRATAVSFVDSKTAAVTGNSYLIPNDGRTVLIVDATAGANVTVATPGTVDGNAIADKVMAAGTAKMSLYGPFPVVTYGAILTVTVSANTDLMALSLA
jgi:hypothetical protein